MAADGGSAELLQIGQQAVGNIHRRVSDGAQLATQCDVRPRPEESPLQLCCRLGQRHVLLNDM